MKILVTGAEGFVGGYIRNELLSHGHEVICGSFDERDGYIQLDILDQKQIEELLNKYRPDAIINMAGQADVGLSWRIPQKTIQLNTIGPVNILEAVRKIDPAIKVVFAGSSDEYGFLGKNGTNVTEDFELKPITPYAISKVMQEKMALIYHKNFCMNVCMARCFTLSGPGQAKGFVITDFASGVAEIENGLKKELLVGNLESARDFTHVKDAAKAYRLIAEKGHSGEIYNICNGVTSSLKEVLEKLTGMSDAQITVKQDPSRMRPSDTPVICGNHDKLTAHTGWRPEYSIDDILFDTLDYWRKHTKA